MGIQRWDIIAVGENTDEMLSVDEGDYVLFTDHEQVVAELTKLADGLSNALQDASLELVRLRAELAEKSKDAERYAWLRERAGQDDDFVEIFIDNESYAPGHLDAQIDSAMGDGDE